MHNLLKPVTVGSALFCYALFYALLGQLIPFFRETYGLNMTEAGLFSIMQFIGSVISTILCIFFLDIFNKPKLLGLALLFFSACIAITGMNLLFPFVLICFCLIGLLMGAMDVLSSAVISDISGDNKAYNINIMQAFFGFGGVMGPLIALFFLDSLGENTVIFIISALSCASALYYIFIFRKEMKDKILNSAGQIRQNIKNVFVVYKKKGMINVFLISVLVAFFEVTVSFWYPSFYIIHMDNKNASAIAIIAYFAMLTLGRLFGSRISRLHKPYVLIAWGSLFTLLFALISVLFKSIYISVAALAACGFFNGGLFPQTFAQSCYIAPENSAMASGLVIFGITISLFFGPLVIGTLGDWIGLKYALIINAFILLPVIYLGLSLKKAIPDPIR